MRLIDADLQPRQPPLLPQPLLSLGFTQEPAPSAGHGGEQAALSLLGRCPQRSAVVGIVPDIMMAARHAALRKRDLAGGMEISLF